MKPSPNMAELASPTGVSFSLLSFWRMCRPWLRGCRNTPLVSMLTATGCGKSEAFFGLVVFNLFLDRIRGKQRGVTALVRYPLRLLTLQQARRLMRILVKA